MDGKSETKPLLLREEDDQSLFKKPCTLRSSIKCFLKFGIWVVFVSWAAFIFLLPLNSIDGLRQKWVQATSGTLFGKTGSVFLLFSGPILLISVMAIVYLSLFGKEEMHWKKTSNRPQYSLWTFPVLTEGPFGVVTAAEIIGILLFYVFIIWAVSSVWSYPTLTWFDVTLGKQTIMKLTARRFGFIGLVCLAFLFLPVARGSVLLRFVHIPFEQAIRYHIWLGHVTMVLFTLHGLLYMIGWGMEGKLLTELIEWKNLLSAHLPGVIGLVAGLMMWITSLPGVRRRNFELFFYTHQLYIVFVIFLALHVGDFVFSIAGAGIFLFMVDRFLRFCQSRRRVDVLSARCFPSGTVELVLSKPANLQYNALGWMFLQIRELSLLQWHPFSVSSSPLDGDNHISVLIKVVGGWTQKLRDCILSTSEEQSEVQQLLQTHSKISAFVEGPYGHESPYHLMYENLILVAGGSGISVFLAILSDILHRIKDGRPCLPKRVMIVWAVKKSDELPLLHTLDMESICPSFSDSLNLEIQTYVTRESAPSLEESKVHLACYSCVFPRSKGRTISSLRGTGNILWVGIYVIVSTLGLVVSFGLLSAFYINPFDITCWWYKGLLFIACMAASTIVFGGLVIGLWLLWERKTSIEEELDDNAEKIETAQSHESGMDRTSNDEHYTSSIHYGQRPDFQEIFESVSKQWGSVDIGVIICGPYTLMSSVARACRRINLKREKNQPIFHFYSHSFEL